MPSIGPFETSRLSVRSWRDDLRDSHSRQSLEKVLQSILTPPVLSALPEPLWLDETAPNIARWIDDRDAESDVRLVLDKSTGSVIGLLILAQVGHPDSPATVHIGYLLAEAAWGQGYATELVSGLVATAQAIGPLRLMGGVATDNPASAKVLQKAGFVLDEHRSTAETQMFRLTV